MSNWSRSPFFWAAIVAAAAIGASLITDAGDSWTEFFAWIGFLVALNVPVLFLPADSNRFCAAWPRRTRKRG